MSRTQSTPHKPLSEEILTGPMETVPALIAAQAAAKPNEPAVSCAGAQLSRAQLDRWSAAIGARLTELGVRPGGRVGIMISPSLAMIASALAILRLGAAYVPVDPVEPIGRVKTVLDDAQVSVVLTDDATRLPADCAPVLRLPSWPAPAEVGIPTAELSHQVAGSDPAYLIYTSGSTGEPKGVLVEHAQLAASTAARLAVYPETEAFLLLSPLAFDSSVAGIWGTLAAGARLVVATADEVRDPEGIVTLIEQEAITTLLCVPSLYRVILDAVERRGASRYSALRTVITAGEPLPPALCERHFQLHPHGTRLVNEYGPTEATVWASYRSMTAPEPISIGTAVPGARLYVLDEARHPVPDGVSGELYIGGAEVARGYFGRPEQTRRAFLPDPFATVAGARMYRTGDRVIRATDGTLRYLGRVDNQVKIRGHRIELEAVESELRARSGVQDAVVLPDQAGTGLLAFLLPADLDVSRLRAELSGLLPPVMVPYRYSTMVEFPRSVNGKIDRKQLRQHAGQAEVGQVQAGSSAGSATAASDPPAGKQADKQAGAADTLADQVAAAWAETLMVPAVPHDANFFDVGGHSLKMFELLDALEKHTGARPSVVELFRHTTVGAQVALIRHTATAPRSTRLPDRTAAAERARSLRARRRSTPLDSTA